MTFQTEYQDQAKLAQEERIADSVDYFDTCFRLELALACKQACAQRNLDKIEEYKETYNMPIGFISWLRQQDSVQLGDDEFMNIFKGESTLEVFESWINTANFYDHCLSELEAGKLFPEID